MRRSSARAAALVGLVAAVVAAACASSQQAPSAADCESVSVVGGLRVLQVENTEADPVLSVYAGPPVGHGETFAVLGTRGWVGVLEAVDAREDSCFDGCPTSTMTAKWRARSDAILTRDSLLVAVGPTSADLSEARLYRKLPGGPETRPDQTVGLIIDTDGDQIADIEELYSCCGCDYVTDTMNRTASGGWALGERTRSAPAPLEFRCCGL